MSNYTTTASVTLNVNGAEAANTLESLKKRSTDLRDALAAAAKKGDSVSLKKLTKELKDTERQIKAMQSNAQTTAEVLRRLDKATPNELKAALMQLNKELKNMERGSKAWKDQTEKIRAVKTELSQVNNELKKNESLWGRFKNTLQEWQTAAVAGVAVLTRLVGVGRSAVDAYASMDAEMANVRKYTGMTAEQVEELNEEFKKMDTRTSREDLNKLAQEAGRLGKTSKEDIMGFVRAADQINVALDDLGEGATLTLSKLTDIFGDEDRLGTERSLLAVGSVVNDLSQNCSASAPYLTEFAKRMGGVGSQAGMTIPQIMAFGAVLDANGQNVEASATALSQVIMRLYQDPAKFAKAAGLEVKGFTKLLKEDANAALITLLEQLNKMGSIDVLAPVFDDMGENGQRAVSALSTLAGKIEDVKNQQVAANQAYNDATSVTKEYNVQNNTVEARLDKAKKKFHELMVKLGEQLLPIMQHSISATSLFAKILSWAISFIIEHKNAIISLAVAIAAYQIAANIAVIKTKLLATWQGICKVVTVAFRVATLASSTAVALFSGSITRATAAFKLLSAAIKLSPIGLFVGLISAAAGALVIFTQKTSSASQAQKVLNGIKDEANKKLIEEKLKIDLLVKAANNETLSLDERKKAIDKLNSIIPNYNAQLDATTGKYKANKQALDKYLESLVHRYEIEGAKSQLSSLGAERVDAVLAKQKAESTLDRRKKDLDDAIKNGSSSIGSYTNLVKIAERDVSNAQYDIDVIDRKIDQITGVYGEDLQKAEANSTPTTLDDEIAPTPTTPPIVTPPNDTPEKFEAEKQWREREEALNRIAYATGEKSYQDYTRRIDEIAVEFYRQQLLHTDLSENERLNIQAQYHEAQVKQSETSGKLTLDAEKVAYNDRLAQAKQFFIDGQYSIEAYNEAIERIESDHLKEMVRLAKLNGTPKQITEAENNLKNFEFNAAQRKQQQTQQAHDKIKKDYFGENAVEDKANYDADMMSLDAVYQAELAAVGDNASEKLRIEEAYQQAKLALAKKYGQAEAEDSRSRFQKLNDDFLGWLDSEQGQAITKSFDTVMSGMGSIFSQVSSLVQAELEMETAAIEKRYDKEISLAEGNTYKVNALEKKKQKELAKAKSEANKKQFAMQVIQAVAQTAQNALNAYGSAAAIPVVGHVLAPIAAAMAITAGTLQIAAIKKQQQASEAQGYSRGGFTKAGAVNEPAGIVHAGEWVASQKLLADPVARPLINALDYAQRTNTIGSLRAVDVSRSITAPMTIAHRRETPQVIVSQTPDYSEHTTKVNEELSQSLTRLNDRLNEPFVTVNTVTGDAGIKKAQDEYQKLIRNKTPKSRR